MTLDPNEFDPGKRKIAKRAGQDEAVEEIVYGKLSRGDKLSVNFGKGMWDLVEGVCFFLPDRPKSQLAEFMVRIVFPAYIKFLSDSSAMIDQRIDLRRRLEGNERQ